MALKFPGNGTNRDREASNREQGGSRIWFWHFLPAQAEKIEKIKEIEKIFLPGCGMIVNSMGKKPTIGKSSNGVHDEWG